MIEVAYKLFFEKHSEKERILATIYCFVMYCFITNWVVGKLGYRYDPSIEISVNSVVNYFFSKPFLIVFISFIAICTFFHYLFCDIILLIASYVLQFAITLPIAIIYKIWKRKTLPKLISENDLPGITEFYKVFSVSDGVRYRNDGRRYEIFKIIAQDIMNDQDAMVYIDLQILTIVSTALCFNFYSLSDFHPFLHFINVILIVFLGLFIIGGMMIKRIYRKKTAVEALLFSIHYEKPIIAEQS